MCTTSDARPPRARTSVCINSFLSPTNSQRSSLASSRHLASSLSALGALSHFLRRVYRRDPSSLLSRDTWGCIECHRYTRTFPYVCTCWTDSPSGRPSDKHGVTTERSEADTHTHTRGMQLRRSRSAGKLLLSHVSRDDNLASRSRRRKRIELSSR